MKTALYPNFSFEYGRVILTLLGNIPYFIDASKHFFISPVNPLLSAPLSNNPCPFSRGKKLLSPLYFLKVPSPSPPTIFLNGVRSFRYKLFRCIMKSIRSEVVKSFRGIMKLICCKTFFVSLHT